MTIAGRRSLDLHPQLERRILTGGSPMIAGDAVRLAPVVDVRRGGLDRLVSAFETS